MIRLVGGGFTAMNYNKPCSSKCRHCKYRMASPSQKYLCKTCRTTPEILRLYPSTNKYGMRGSGVKNVPVRLPEPTTTLPGTEGRLLVLEGRARRGEALHHPEDA